MRRAVGVGVLLSLVVLAGASAAQHAEPPGAAFVGADGELFGLGSNSQWLVNGKHVHAVRTNRAANAKSSDPAEREPMQTIWAPACLSGAQEVHFTREVYVAGPLWKLSAYVGGAEPHPAFFKRFEVLINGRLVLRTNGGGGGLQSSESKGQVVHFGRNLFEVVAYKKPFSAGYGCRKGGTGRTGINFVFRGDFGNDLWFPNPPKEDYVPGGSRAYKLDFDLAIQNKGPGGLGAGILTVVLDAPEGELSGVSKLTLPQPSSQLVGCTERQEGREYRRRIECRLANLRRGVTINPDFSFYGSAPFPVSDIRVRVDSFVDGGYQIGNGRDNFKTDVVVFCAAGSTNPKCPG